MPKYFFMRFSFAVFFFTVLNAAQAQQILFEEDFTAGIPASWYLVNADGLTPAAPVNNFVNAWIPFINNGDTCAASTSYYTPEGQSADYLITPRISLESFSKLFWNARSYDASYADGYLVLISTTDSAISSFTDTIHVQPAENFYWQTHGVQLDLEGYANQDVFIAFKNTTQDGYILMIDNVRVLGSDFVSLEKSTPEVTYGLYPNPATDIITLSGVPANTTVFCYAVTGELMFTTTAAQPDISALAPGCYYLRVQSDLNQVTLPFIKE